MIIFGSRSKSYAGKRMQGPPCPDCGYTDYSSFGKMGYFHIFWIPTFPFSKKVGLECHQCRKVIMDRQIPASYAESINKSVFTKGAFIRKFTGLFIILAFFALMAISDISSNIKENALYGNPMEKDLYIVDLSKDFFGIDTEYKYGVLRISRITEEGIEFELSQISYTSEFRISKDISNGSMDSDEYFGDKQLHLSFQELAEMKDSETIASIKRL